MDTYVRRTTRAFSFIWSIFALALAVVAVLLGVMDDTPPDYFIVLYAGMTGVGGGGLGFFHGVTLSAARRLDSVENEEQS